MSETGPRGLDRIIGLIRGESKKAPKTPEQLKQEVVRILNKHARLLELGIDSQGGYGDLSKASHSYLKAYIDFTNLGDVVRARTDLLQASEKPLQRIRQKRNMVDAYNMIDRFAGENEGADVLPTELGIKKQIGKFVVSIYSDSYLAPNVRDNVFQEKAQDIGVSEAKEILSQSVPGIDLNSRAQEWLDIKQRIITLETQYPEEDEVFYGYKHESVRHMPDDVLEHYNSLIAQGEQYFINLAEDVMKAQTSPQN